MLFYTYYNFSIRLCRESSLKQAFIMETYYNFEWYVIDSINIYIICFLLIKISLKYKSKRVPPKQLLKCILY